MHATYWKDDDILEVRFSDKPIAREASENWHIHNYLPRCELPAAVRAGAMNTRNDQTCRVRWLF